MLNYFLDVSRRSWNIFDFVLVGLMLFETIPSHLSSQGFPTLPSMSYLRLLRLLRIVRALRMVPELAMMVKSMLAAMRSVSMTAVLGFGIFYVFAILFTQWAQRIGVRTDCDGIECVHVSFGTIPKTFITLMQILCFDNTFSVIRSVMDLSLTYGLMLILFIMLAAFTVLNMLIGVICEIVSVTNEGEREKNMKESRASFSTT